MSRRSRNPVWGMLGSLGEAFRSRTINKFFVVKDYDQNLSSEGKELRLHAAEAKRERRRQRNLKNLKES